MELEKTIEKYIREVSDVFRRYFWTMNEISFHADGFFKRVFSDSISKKQVNPAFFLLINLIGSNSIVLLFGYKMPDNPIKNNILGKYVNDWEYFIFTYALGYLLFSLIMYFISKWFSGRKIALKNCFDLLCYGSFVFVPMVFGELLSYAISDGPIEKILMDNISCPHRTSNFNLTGITLMDYLRIIASYLITIIFLWLWFRVINCGLKNLLIKKYLRISVFSTGAYLFLSMGVSVFYILCSYFASITALRAVSNNEIENEMAKAEPNKILILKTTTDIYQNEKFPNRIRYGMRWVNLACGMEMQRPVEFKGLLKEVYLQSEHFGDLLIEDLNKQKIKILKPRTHSYSHMSEQSGDLLNEDLIKRKINDFKPRTCDEILFKDSVKKEIEVNSELKKTPDGPDVFQFVLTPGTYSIKNNDNSYIKKAYPNFDPKSLQLQISLGNHYTIFQIFPHCYL